MESYPAKKAIKAKKPLDAVYPLEWEDQALNEVIQGFQAGWKENPERFEELTQENESINAPHLPAFESENKELIALYKETFRLLILRDPFLYRILAYISLDPEDREARMAFFERYLHRNIFQAYYEILDFENILEGSELAKSRKFSSIPVHSCFVGKVLAHLLDEAESLWITDNGIPEFFRIEKNGNTYILHCLNEEAYKDKSEVAAIDDILYRAIRESKGDRRRQDVFLGDGLDRPRYRVIKRYQGKERQIPLALLPKYAGLIRNTAKRAYHKEPEDGLSDAITTFIEAVLDQTPEKIKPVNLPFSAFIKNKITWGLGDEWDNESIQRNGKRTSKEAIEHEAGSLDDWNDKLEATGRRGNIIKDDNSLDPESRLLEHEQSALEENLRKYLATTTDPDLIRLIRIHVQETRRSEADQKFYNRKWENKIKELREMFDITT